MGRRTWCMVMVKLKMSLKQTLTITWVSATFLVYKPWLTSLQQLHLLLIFIRGCRNHLDHSWTIFTVGRSVLPRTPRTSWTSWSSSPVSSGSDCSSFSWRVWKELNKAWSRYSAGATGRDSLSGTRGGEQELGCQVRPHVHKDHVQATCLVPSHHILSCQAVSSKRLS